MKLPLLAALLIASPVSLYSSDQILFDSSHRVDLNKIQSRDATVSGTESPEGFMLCIATGHQSQWPGITISAPGGSWNLAANSALTLKMKNTGQREAEVRCRVDNPGADGTKHCITGSLSLAPGKSGTLRVELMRAGDSLGGNLFGMKGYPAGPVSEESGIDSSKVTALLISIRKPDSDHEIVVWDIRATGDYTPPTASVTDATPFLPFIDTFGQYKHRDWPGKTKSLDDLISKREAEAKTLDAMKEPPGWDQYGGWSAGPTLKATGFFRTEKYQNKWWLVDPDGHLFFSQGIDCIRSIDSTPVEERDGWFEDFPGGRPEFNPFCGTSFALLGHYAGRSPKCFSFSGANLLRKYGPAWRTAYSEIVQKRLRSWGVNTIGNWSDENICRMDRTPYTESIGSAKAKMIQGSKGYWGKFPDVFAPDFSAAVRSSMATKGGKSAGDPWCIGYFSDNEMSWGDDTSLALAALKSPYDQPAKREFVSDLKAKYHDIRQLNSTWGTNHTSWEALLSSCEVPDKKMAYGDLTAFYTKASETYFSTVRDVIKEIAPNQLYLGCRFADANDLAAKAASKYCDIVSYNLYRRSVEDFQFAGGDKPLLVGEFHFGALDRGLFHTGLVPVANQKERAESYRNYVLGAARNPLFVGTHWFEWKDEPTTGRIYDGENYQIGFVDVADTPYPEMSETSRQVAEKMYRVHLEN